MIFRVVEKEGRTIKKIFMDPIGFTNFRNLAHGTLDINSDYISLKMGIVAEIWGAQIWLKMDGQILSPWTIFVEDNVGKKRQVCAKCMHLFEEVSCPTNLCMVAYVLEE